MGQQEVYQLLKESTTPLSVKEISEKLGMNKSRVYQSCKVMLKYNEIGMCFLYKDEVHIDTCKNPRLPAKFFVNNKQ